LPKRCRSVYQQALELAGDDQRARSVLHSNMSACDLALGNATEALREAEAAVAADATFEKGHVRCGAALERTPGRRADALAAYQRAEESEVAKKRIAVLEVPRVVGPEGVSGIEKGSLDLRNMAPFENAGAFFAEAMAPHEFYDDHTRAATTENADGRMALMLTADTVAKRLALRERGICLTTLSSHNLSEHIVLFFTEGFKQLTDVSDDGRHFETGESASTVPVLPVVYGLFPNAKVGLWTFPSPVIAAFARMLEDNTALLSEESKAALFALPIISEFGTAPFRSGMFRASVLTPICAVPSTVIVFERCAFPGCEVEECQYRCGKCLLVRYCGSEHSTQHWREHKPVCVPVSLRPCVELVSKDGWSLVKRGNPLPNGFPDMVEGKSWPVQVRDGIAVVKLIFRRADQGVELLICDQNGATAIRLVPGDVISESSLRQLEEFVHTSGTPIKRYVGNAWEVHGKEDSELPVVSTVTYCDANLSDTGDGRIRLYIDKAHNCIW
jgi:hypothetical protein